MIPGEEILFPFAFWSCAALSWEIALFLPLVGESHHGVFATRKRMKMRDVSFYGFPEADRDRRPIPNSALSLRESLAGRSLRTQDCCPGILWEHAR